MRAFAIALLSVLSTSAASIPAGTDLQIRLTTKIATETTVAGSSVSAIVIAPVRTATSAVVLPSGVQVSGIAKQVRAATESDAAILELRFTGIQSGPYKAAISSQVVSVDNARELIGDGGVINGVDPTKTYSARVDQGISKLEGTSRFGGLASILNAAKKALDIEDANANIDYDAGIELIIRLTKALVWSGPMNGAESKLVPFPGAGALATLVNNQPFRTVAQKPPKESDMTNLMFVGTEEQLRAAFQKAGWSEPAKLNSQSRLGTARALIASKGYNEGPMSILLLDGNQPAMAFEKGNNTFGKRHHLRIFRRPDTFAGKPIWVCSSTHDVNIDFSEKDRTFIHKVDSEIDRERAKVVNDLVFTGLVRSTVLIDRPNVPRSIANATGDSLTTDGKMAVVLFQ